MLPVDGEDLTATKAKINSDFKAFEQQLFEKYALPPSGEDEHMNEDNDELRLLVDTAPPLNDTSYVLTRSLYASHKQINLADTAVEADNTKLITALSINEIETRRSFVSDGNTSDDNDSETSSVMSDEKKIKEEIVLIGERGDIESLLDNKNNQLYNLIISNASRTQKLDEIECNLNKVCYLFHHVDKLLRSRNLHGERSGELLNKINEINIM